MISACPNRFDNGVEPLTLTNQNGQVALYLFDGSGSWGSGAETAAWFREWIAASFQDSEQFTTSSVTETLSAAIQEIPSDLRDSDFGWRFSLAVVLCEQHTVLVGATGAFAAVALLSGRMNRLVVPVRLVDELVKQGTISAAEAKTHHYRRIICSPCFGEDNQPGFKWSQAVSSDLDGVIVVGGADLPQFLETQECRLKSDDALELRDAVEARGGSSTATAIVTFPVNSG